MATSWPQPVIVMGVSYPSATIHGTVTSNQGTMPWTETIQGGYIYARQDTIPWTSTIGGGYIWTRPDPSFPAPAAPISNTSFEVWQGPLLWAVDVQRIGFGLTIQGQVSPAAGTSWKIIPLWPTLTVTGQMAVGQAVSASIINIANVFPTLTVTGSLTALVGFGPGVSVYTPSGYTMPVSIAPAVSASIIFAGNIFPSFTITGTVNAAELSHGPANSASIIAVSNIFPTFTVTGSVSITPGTPATTTDYQVSVGTSPTSLTGVAPPSGTARRLWIFNPASEPLYIGGSNTRTWTGTPIPAGGSLLIDNIENESGRFYGIYPTVTRLVQVGRN